MGNIYFISGPCGCGKSTLTDATPRCIIPFGVDAKVDAEQQIIRFS